MHLHAAAGDNSHHHDHGHDHSQHDHGGGHHHGHHHHHVPASFDRAFAIGIALNAAFVLVEAIFGFRAHSLALTADAGHNLGDVLGLVLAWAGTALARRGPTARRTYGLRRFSILAAMANAGVLLVSVGAIGVEAIQRLLHPAEVATTPVMVVAAIGIIVNGCTALGFMRGRQSDVNIRGAFLHMLGDAATSAGVVVAALVISATGLLWIDPMVSLLIAALITWGTWGLARDSFNLALDAVPRHIDPATVREHLMALDAVTDVHDLHIWGMSTTDVALTAHLCRSRDDDLDALLANANAMLRAEFGIGHATLQVERGHEAYPCDRVVPGVV